MFVPRLQQCEQFICKGKYIEFVSRQKRAWMFSCCPEWKTFCVISALRWMFSFGMRFVLDKATNPSNRQEEWEHVMAFCEQVNKDPQGWGHIASKVSECSSCLVLVVGKQSETLCVPAPSFPFLLIVCKNQQATPHLCCSPQTSLRLLVHKIQSPQEWEALQALTVQCVSTPVRSFDLGALINMRSPGICFSLQVLETCMKNCGGRFHSEVAKFKFLNELVKVISTKVCNCR